MVGARAATRADQGSRRRISDLAARTRTGAAGRPYRRCHRLSCPYGDPAGAAGPDPLGPKAAKTFDEAFGIRTVGDLLRHYPRRYHHRGELTDLAALREGEHVTVLAQVVSVRHVPDEASARARSSRSPSPTACSTLILTFFSARGNPWQRRLTPGTHGLFSGEVSTFRNQRQLVHPDFEPISADEAGTELAAEYAAAIIPVYPATSEAAVLADRQVHPHRPGRAGRRR